MRIQCPKCSGAGVTSSYMGERQPCHACHGKGTLTEVYWKKMTEAQRMARLALKVKHG